MITAGNLFSSAAPAPEMLKKKRQHKAPPEQIDKYQVTMLTGDGSVEVYRAPFESDCLSWLWYHKADIYAGWNNYKTADGVQYEVKRITR